MAYRPTKATEAARREREAALFEAAHGIVADAGFASASVKAIAEAAGVSAGTVYTYFGSSDELLAEVFRAAAGRELDEVRRAVAAAGQAPGRGRARREISALVGTFACRARAGRTLAWAALVAPAGGLIDADRLAPRRHYAQEMEAIVTRGIEARELPEQDPRIVGPGLIGLISEALTGPLSPEGAVPAEHLISGVTDMCLRAVGGAQ